MNDNVNVNVNVIDNEGNEDIYIELDKNLFTEKKYSIGGSIIKDQNTEYRGNMIVERKYNEIFINYTDLHCWWCSHKFDSYNVSIPLNHNSNTDIFKVYGVFCSFSCASTYLKHKPLFERSDSLCLLKYLYIRLTGKKYIKDAPSNYLLDIFGGPLTIEEFRKESQTLYKILEYPCIPLDSYIQEFKPIEKVNKINKNNIYKPLNNKVDKGDIKQKQVVSGKKGLGFKIIKKK